MPDYYRFKVHLLNVTPAPWREFMLRETATFLDLHHGIQDACGWMNCHLFTFHADLDRTIIAGSPDDDPGQPDADPRKVGIARIFDREFTQCYYQYDFGDDWWHEVNFVGREFNSDRFYRSLLGGGRSFPPEDCGGISGYQDCVALLEGKPLDHEDPEGLRAWLGDWHPERLDVIAAKQEFFLRTRPANMA